MTDRLFADFVDQLFAKMTTADLRDLRAAFALDMANATDETVMAFCIHRIAVIDHILKERGDDDV